MPCCAAPSVRAVSQERCPCRIKQSALGKTAQKPEPAPHARAGAQSSNTSDTSGRASPSAPAAPPHPHPPAPFHRIPSHNALFRPAACPRVWPHLTLPGGRARDAPRPARIGLTRSAPGQWRGGVSAVRPEAQCPRGGGARRASRMMRRPEARRWARRLARMAGWRRSRRPRGSSQCTRRRSRRCARGLRAHAAVAPALPSSPARRAVERARRCERSRPRRGCASQSTHRLRLRSGKSTSGLAEHRVRRWTSTTPPRSPTSSASSCRRWHSPHCSFRVAAAAAVREWSLLMTCLTRTMLMQSRHC